MSAKTIDLRQVLTKHNLHITISKAELRLNILFSELLETEVTDIQPSRGTRLVKLHPRVLDCIF